MEHVMDKGLYWWACVEFAASASAFALINVENDNKKKTVFTKYQFPGPDV